nr:hypothetical protein [Candidatus Sigynarchaeota archaeon]
MSTNNEVLEHEVLELLKVERPRGIKELVKLIRDKTAKDDRDIVAFLLEMTLSNRLYIKRKDTGNEWFARFFRRHQFLQKIICDYVNEPVIKAMAAIIVINLLSWVIIVAFQASVALLAFKIVILGLDYLFMPGFAITIAWYPFPSRRIDFNRLKKEESFRGVPGTGSAPKNESIDFLTRTGYAICYSIAMIVLIGFLLGVLNLGFNIMAMHLVFSVIEVAVIINILVKIKRIKDPYYAI